MCCAGRKAGKTRGMRRRHCSCVPSFPISTMDGSNQVCQGGRELEQAAGRTAIRTGIERASRVIVAVAEQLSRYVPYGVRLSGRQQEPAPRALLRCNVHVQPVGPSQPSERHVLRPLLDAVVSSVAYVVSHRRIPSIWTRLRAFFCCLDLTWTRSDLTPRLDSHDHPPSRAAPPNPHSAVTLLSPALSLPLLPRCILPSILPLHVRPQTAPFAVVVAFVSTVSASAPLHHRHSW